WKRHAAYAGFAVILLLLAVHRATLGMPGQWVLAAAWIAWFGQSARLAIRGRRAEATHADIRQRLLPINAEGGRALSVVTDLAGYRLDALFMTVSSGLIAIGSWLACPGAGGFR